STHVAELRGNRDLAAPPRNRLSDQTLVGKRPVHVGGIEERDTEIDRPMNRRNRCRIVAAGIKLRHPHAAEAFGRYRETRPSERALFHLLTLSPEKEPATFFRFT